jgi:DNA replication protein DnaC
MFQPFKTCGDPALIEMKTAAMEFCLAMGSKFEPARWLTLLGMSGTGKTMLAKLCAKFFNAHLTGFYDERFNPEKEIRYRAGGMRNWSKVMREMVEGDYTGLERLRGDWFVALDDIGAEYQRSRELSASKLYDVLNSREGLFTVITANLSQREIGEQIDPRIASRLMRHGGVVIEVKAKDFNLR